MAYTIELNFDQIDQQILFALKKEAGVSYPLQWTHVEIYVCIPGNHCPSFNLSDLLIYC